MLTDNDREFIQFYTETRPDERYQEIPRYAFKGSNAFDIYLRLGLNHGDNWNESFTLTQKNECFLLATIQTTLSKAVLRNPSLMPKTLQRRLRLYFCINNNTLPSASAYTSTLGQKWLKILSDAQNNLI